MTPTLAAYVEIAYGALVLLGGLLGYMKARSKPSLIMGGLFGLALLCFGVLGLRGWPHAALSGAVLAGFLLLFFGMRFLRKGKFMPAGMLALLSMLALAVEVGALVTASRAG